jgi:pimeloyl-ACP methyl ester carboxylesterase
MSRPPFLGLPPRTRAYRLKTGRGSFAVLDSAPAAEHRGTALLVPGYTGSKEDFIALLEPLAAVGFRTVAVDGRGQHETGGPGAESAYAQEELAADLVAQAEALKDGGGPVHLLGHSMGGLVARAAVLAGAGQAAGRWASLTLMSSGPGAIEPAQRSRTKLLIDALAAMGMESVWDAMREMDGEQAAGTDGIDEFLRRRWLGNVPQQLMATGRQLIAEPDRVGELAAVAALPKLVVSGEVDHVWPVPWLDVMAERLSARRVVIEGAEHSPNAERPERTALALARFWGDASGGK